MELELGFKISKTLDDYSSADLRISKYPLAGPIFVSKETGTMFFLTAHLKGYKKEHVQVEINEDGTQITISGERMVQEMVMINWQMHKKEPELRRFRKVFNIPEGVNLDKIKARFIESDLTISMPKLVKGFHGSKIEEITEEAPSQKENENLAKENDEIVSELISSKENGSGERIVEETEDSVQKENENLAKENDEIVSELISSKENGSGERIVEETENSVQKENENLAKENDEIVSELISSKENGSGERIVEETKNSVQKENENVAKENDEIVSELISSKENGSAERIVEETEDSVQKENENLAKENDEIAPVTSPSKENGNTEQVVDEDKDVVSKEIPHMESEKQGLESDNFPGKNIVGQEEERKSVVEQQANEERQSNEKECKLCIPMIAGAAIIVSIIAFVMHMIRAKNAPTRKKS